MIAKEKQVVGHDNLGRPLYRLVHSGWEIAQANSAANSAGGLRGAHAARLAALQQQLKIADGQRIIAGTLDGGAVAEIEVQGAALVVIADMLTPGSRWRITGDAYVGDGVLHIKLRTLAKAVP
jgi:hypothetical protein